MDARSTLVALVAVGCVGSLQVPTPAAAYVLKQTEDGQPIRWSEGTIRMRAASGASCGPSDAEIAAALDIAVEAWRVDLVVPDVVIEPGEPPPEYGYQPAYYGEGNGIYVVCDAWPFERTLAVTLATSTPAGEMIDADIVINGRQMLSLLPDAGAPVNDHDLASVLTHEMGHVLGLDESDRPSATMWPTTAPGDTGQRTLSADDEAGVLALYGDGSVRLESYGCATSGRAGTSAGSGSGRSAWALALVGLLLLRRRRHRSTPSGARRAS